MECCYWLSKMTAFLSPDNVRERYNKASKKLLNWRHISLSMFGQLEAFHHGVARQLTGTRARFCRATSEWSAPPIEGVLEQAGLLPIREYISRRQNTAIEYITTRPIYETALAARRRSGSSSRRKRWWHQVDTGDDD